MVPHFLDCLSICDAIVKQKAGATMINLSPKVAGNVYQFLYIMGHGQEGMFPLLTTPSKLIAKPYLELMMLMISQLDGSGGRYVERIEG